MIAIKFKSAVEWFKAGLVCTLCLMTFAAAGNCQPQTHTECQGTSCVNVPGPGANQCSTHSDCQRHKCENFSCNVVPKDGQPSSCSSNAHCDTECSVDGAGTGSVFGEGKCGECTSGACAGKSVGDKCKLTGAAPGEAAMAFVAAGGKCVSSDFCSHADPGGKNYEGACGMQCACDTNPGQAQILECTNCSLNR